MLAVVVASSLPVLAPAQTVTWSGGNTTWTQPDSDSWTSATYNSGNTAVFAGSGTGTVTIDAGGVTPGQVNVTAGSYTFSGGGIGGSGGIAKSGAGTLTLTAANTYSGSTSITAGMLTIQNSTALGGTAAGTTVSSSATLGLQGGITVSGESLSIAGDGITSLDGALRNISGTNTWAGSVAVSLVGNVNLTNGVGGLSRIVSDTSSRLVISGPVSIAAGTFNGTAGTAAALLLQGNGTGEISGNITGGVAGAMTVARGANGSGVWTLSGSNSYLGYTGINNNPLVAAGGFAIPDTSLVYFLNAGSLTLQASETIGSLTSDSATASINLNSHTLTIGADNATPVAPGGATTYLGSIIGTGGIAKVGSGLLTLTGSSSFSGGTMLSTGTLRVSNAAALGAGSLAVNGGALDLRSSLSVGSLSGTGGTISGGTTGSFTLTTTMNSSGTFSGSITNGSATAVLLTKAGSGALTLSANNSYSGGTTLNAGVLSFANNGLGTSGNVTLNGGTLQWASGNTQDISSRLVLVSGGTATLDIGTNNVTLASGFGGSTTAALVKLGSGTLTLSGGGANTYTGTTTVSAGALTLNKTAGVTAVPGNLVISDAVLTFGTSSQIADTSAVTMSGSNAAFNSPGGYNNAAPSVTALDETIGSLTVTGGVFFPGGAGSTTGFVVTGSASFTGGSGNTSYLQSSGGLSSYGRLALVGMTDTTQTGTTFVPNRLALAGNNISRQTTLTVGSGGLSLDGSNLLLQLGGSNALGSRLVLNGDVTTTGNSASSIRAPASETNTVGTRAVELSGTTGSFTRTFTIGGGGADLTVSIPITNGSATTAGITKAGVGTLTLGTANTYTGTTTISAGTLALGSAGSFANSTRITVGDTGSSGAVLDLTAKTGTFAFTSSQTVGGIGTINIGSGKTVSSAGLWAPGNSIGSNAVTGNLTLSGTSQFELGTPGTSTSAPGSSDFTAVSGTLTLGGALTLLDNAGANGNGSAAGGVYRLFTYGNAVSGSYASVTANPTPSTRTSLGNISYGGSGTAAGQGVFLSIYNLAAANIVSGTTVNFGTVLKGTSLSQALSITNTAPGGSFTEGLDAAFGALSGGATTNSGSISLLAGGSTSTAMTVGLGSATAGAKSGSAVVNYTSDGAGTSGLGEVGAGSQTVNLSATVLDPAVASFGSGPTALTTLTLDFLSVNQGDSVSPQNFSLYNLLQTAGFTADLALLSITPGLGNTDALSTNLTTFNSLASGTFNSWQATVNTLNQGTFTNTWTLQFKSANGGTVYSGDTTQTLTLTTNVIVVPEPAALALAGIGIAAAAYALRRRK